MSSSDESDSIDGFLNETLQSFDIHGDQDDDALPESWVEVPDYEDKISIDGIEAYLMDTARKEIAIVSKRMMEAMYGQRKRVMSNVTPVDTLQYFLDSGFLAGMKTFMNKSLRNQVQHWELLAFVAIELALSYYTCTPGRYFDEDSKLMFPSVRHATISKNRYFQMLGALGSSPSRSELGETWVPPLEHAREIAGGMQLARGICSAIGYVERVSILSLDDDLLRLRSSLIDAFGLAATNNPKKGMGVTQHGIVSLCTNLFCCGHVGFRGESVVEVVQILLASLKGKSVLSSSKIYNLLAFDRGYGGTAGEVMNVAIELGCDLNGTAKKINSFPFTFGRVPARRQVCIQEDGARCVYWKQKRDRALQAAGKTHYALAYRTGLSRVVLGQTTLPMCAPGQWEFVTKGRSDDAPAIETNGLLLAFETENVVQKTEGQRSPEWFLLRFGCITGTAAYSVFSAMAKK